MWYIIEFNRQDRITQLLTPTIVHPETVENSRCLICACWNVQFLEMLVLKKWSIQLLNALNKYYKRFGKQEVATGSLEQETSKLMTDREAYAAAVDGRHMHEFISSFNKLNMFTMIAHPVGMHHDFNGGAWIAWEQWGQWVKMVVWEEEVTLLAVNLFLLCSLTVKEKRDNSEYHDTK